MRSSAIHENASLITSSKLVLLDTNFSVNVLTSIIKLCYDYKVPLVVSSVSVSKMRKLPRNLNGVEWMVCNVGEAEAYLGLKIDDDERKLEAAKLFHEHGVKHVVFTSGADSVLFASHNGVYGRIPILPVQGIVDVTGAGDAFIAGMIYGITEGYEMEQVCQFGISCASLTLQTDRAVSLTISPETLRAKFNQLYGRNSQNFVFFKGVYLRGWDT
jgi:sugar/nucleoside kinase (ribokinase family)